jgi:hypothetical protein
MVAKNSWLKIAVVCGVLGELQELIGQPDVADVVGPAAAAGARGGHAHAEGVGALGHLGADAAEADDQHGLALKVAQLRGVLAPVPLRLLAQEVIEVAAQGQHEGDHVLSHARGRGALHVGEQHLVSAQQRLLHAALDPCAEPLDPLQVHRFLQHLRAAHPKGGIGARDLARARLRQLDEPRPRVRVLQLRERVVQVGGDQDQLRGAPAGALAHGGARGGEP